VNVNSAVVVPDDLPLDVLAPLGCGIQTGADTLAIFGAGAVGLAAVMAAALTPASKIIVVDIVESKLELARELGATHVINSAKCEDVVKELRGLSGGLGVDRAMDTSGNIGVIQDTMLNCVAPGGIAATVGTAPPDKKVEIAPAKWVAKGVSYVGVHQGSSVPKMVGLIELCLDLGWANVRCSLYRILFSCGGMVGCRLRSW
jgi:aryl-alcohol dehydrogenase